MSARQLAVAVIGCLATVHHCDAQAVAYAVAIDAVTLRDVDTNIEDIVAIQNGYPFEVYADLVWDDETWLPDSNNTLSWKTSSNGVVQATGVIELVEHNPIPKQILVGEFSTPKSGAYTIEVTVSIDESSSSNERQYQSYPSGASFIPLIVIIFLAATTNMVELSLGFGIFVGCCMVAGSLTGGFRDMLAVYILQALASEDHGYVYLFILFMAGLVGIIEKSGGLSGITVALQRFVKSTRTAQGTSFFAGLIIFFDDYSNTLVAGSSMRPLTDACVVSREKLAFIVDATSAPIASIAPISSWIGFEIGLIQSELNKIKALYPDSTIGNTSAFAVFLETIQYRYYCIFMLIFIPFLIVSGRDFGPMLVAERLTKVYGRTDGGPGKVKAVTGGDVVNHNAPSPGTPCKWYNMAVPIVMLIIYIFYLLVWTGMTNPDATGAETFVEIMSFADAYTALLWGTMAGALTAVAFYFMQDHKDGRIIWFNLNGYKNKVQRFIIRKRGTVSGDEDEEVHARVLMNVREAMTAFLVGMEKIFGALVVLTLAWASGAIMQAVGLDRFFGAIIGNDALDYRALPTLTFIISILIAFATGSSWGTMTIMFPLVVVPAYEASNGDTAVFYGVIAAILAGAVAGDHASPISDTTILSAMASGCEVLQHVKTQGPYAVMVATWSILLGTLPVGMKSYPNFVGILLGALAMLFHAVVTAESTINKTGRFDIFTELYIRCIKEKDFYLSLKADVIEAYETGRPVLKSDCMPCTRHETKDLEESNDSFEHAAVGEEGAEETIETAHVLSKDPEETIETAQELSKEQEDSIETEQDLSKESMGSSTLQGSAKKKWASFTKHLMS